MSKTQVKALLLASLMATVGGTFIVIFSNWQVLFGVFLCLWANNIGRNVSDELPNNNSSKPSITIEGYAFRDKLNSVLEKERREKL